MALVCTRNRIMQRVHNAQLVHLVSTTVNTASVEEPISLRSLAAYEPRQR